MGATRSTIPFFLLFIAPALLLSCPARNTTPAAKVETVNIKLDQEFKIRVGQQITVGTNDVKLKFVGVGNDSRCPRDVTCVWAGNAEVMIQVESGGKPADLKLNTSGAPNLPKQAELRGYGITLVRLNPDRYKDKPIKASDYEATFVIHKQ